MLQGRSELWLAFCQLQSRRCPGHQAVWSWWSDFLCQQNEMCEVLLTGQMRLHSWVCRSVRQTADENTHRYELDVVIVALHSAWFHLLSDETQQANQLRRRLKCHYHHTGLQSDKMAYCVSGVSHRTILPMLGSVWAIQPWNYFQSIPKYPNWICRSTHECSQMQGFGQWMLGWSNGSDGRGSRSWSGRRFLLSGEPHIK